MTEYRSMTECGSKKMANLKSFNSNVSVLDFVSKPDLAKLFDKRKTFGHLLDLHILQTGVTNSIISEKEAVSLAYFNKTLSG